MYPPLPVLSSAIEENTVRYESRNTLLVLTNYGGQLDRKDVDIYFFNA